MEWVALAAAVIGAISGGAGGGPALSNATNQSHSGFNASGWTVATSGSDATGGSTMLPLIIGAALLAEFFLVRKS